MALHILPLQNPQTFRQFFMPNQAETGRIPQILAKMGYEEKIGLRLADLAGALYDFGEMPETAAPRRGEAQRTGQSMGA